MLKQQLILQGKFGLEKENLRVDKDGKLSNKPHPRIFGEENQYITRDFAEAQLEMITPPLSSVEEAYDFLGNIQNIVISSLEDEYLWPQSNPPILPEDEAIRIAEYVNDTEKNDYRAYLSQKYGNKRAVISGIHFNLSFGEDMLKKVFDGEDKNAIYLKVSKYFMKYRWFFIHLLSASPVFHSSYVQACVDKSLINEAGDCNLEGVKSLRNSVCGYRNIKNYTLDYNNYSAYQKSIQSLVTRGEIRAESELYTAVRIKKNQAGDAEYLELRFIDSNPLFTNGVALEDLQLLHLFAIYFAKLPDFDFSKEEQMRAGENQDRLCLISENGLGESLVGETFSAEYTALNLLQEVKAFSKEVGIHGYDYQAIIDMAKSRINDPSVSYANQIIAGVEHSNYVEYHLSIAEKYKQQTKRESFALIGYKDMELSTQILLRSAIKRGLDFEILDRKDNFIRLIHPKTKQVEYIKEATKTSADFYSQVLAMENKNITKQILLENGIQTPIGKTAYSVAEGLQFFELGELSSKLVVKPNTTNFGRGITIFPESYTKEMLSDALEFALSEDDTILLEPFLSGKEYRFLIIDDKVEGVLYRRPANVLGDGKKTIAELVEQKNQDYLRGTGYKTPLEKIIISTIEKEYLKQQGFTLDYIPKEDERIYLRENSNVSTGGDSIDVTDEVDASYKEIAVKAARALNVKITGVDMLIDSLTEEAMSENHGIIELNFNPAIHIHCYPYHGKNRNIGEKVIDLLFKK